MKVFSSPKKIQHTITHLKRRGFTIGVVPTMGALHEGHMSLVRLAKKKSDVVVLTIFVNPTQFGPREDFSSYPRPKEQDLALARGAGVDMVFMPSRSAMYRGDHESFVDLTSMSKVLCGASRPNHFRGVTTVVTKLFNITQPDFAIFGKKDYQQFRVIQKMAQDLDFPIKIIGAPIMREPDGLAMSSRNQYLSPSEREIALLVSRELLRIKKLAAIGLPRERLNLAKIKQGLQQAFKKQREIKIDYIETCSAKNLQAISSHQKNNTLIAVAVRIGRTRLIDNVVV